ncbi:MAG: hypothetical protein M3Q45_02395, partial [Chloroflexota bacterium]|nr:hypothetical protein [Chloroflexota bacterium]
PDNIYASLVNAAKQLDESPEQVALHYLTTAIERLSDDPLEQFIGAFDSKGSQWADRHDAYLGLALLAETSADDDTGLNNG